MDLDHEIADGTIRQLREHEKLELRMAAEYRERGDDVNAARLEHGAARWAQLAAWAPRVFADCDALAACAANAAADAEACDTQEMPRVH